MHAANESLDQAMAGVIECQAKVDESYCHFGNTDPVVQTTQVILIDLHYAESKMKVRVNNNCELLV